MADGEGTGRGLFGDRSNVIPSRAPGRYTRNRLSMARPPLVPWAEEVSTLLFSATSPRTMNCIFGQHQIERKPTRNGLREIKFSLLDKYSHVVFRTAAPPASALVPSRVLCIRVFNSAPPTLGLPRIGRKPHWSSLFAIHIFIWRPGNRSQSPGETRWRSSGHGRQGQDVELRISHDSYAFAVPVLQVTDVFKGSNHRSKFSFIKTDISILVSLITSTTATTVTMTNDDSWGSRNH